ncbi:MAG: glycosyl hydrolase [Thermoguttaceae bacterium]|jgi:hypothetical protein
MQKTIFTFAVALAAQLLVCAVGVAESPDSPEARALQERYLGATAANATASDFKVWFHEAPSTFHDGKTPLKGLPLWHTNGELTDEIIHEIFEVGQRNGFGGVTFLPLTRTTPKYLTEDYFRQYGKALDLADKLGMKVIFYDDVDFPSGTAGGRLKELFPDSTIKRLDKAEWEAKGPAKFVEKCPIGLADKALFGAPSGVLQAAVAMNTSTFERVNLRDCVAQDGTVTWDVPEGDWKIFVFVCVADARDLVDYMSPSSVKNFLSLTYDTFYERFPERFGTTITASFFDDITNTQTEGARNWALEFNDKYRELWNADPDLDYPALFCAIGDETPSARYRLWTTRNRLFADGYIKLVNEWRRERGIDMITTGHPQGPYVIQPVDMSGDGIASHKHSDAVLFDSIHYYGHGRDGFKIPTSAAFNYDFPLCFVEIYGNYRDNSFDPSMMYRSAMEIFARGGNLLLPHGIWTDPASVYIPPEISWRNPKLKGFLPRYGDFVSRCSMMLQGGRHVADFAFLYPVDNLKAFYRFQKAFVNGDYPYGVLIPRETDYLGVGADFSTRLWRDFTFLHPQVLDEKCSVETKDGETLLRLDNVSNWEEFRVFVIPGADVISLANLEKIFAFYEAGGRVLATTRLPSIAAEGPDGNARVCEIVESIFGVDPLTQAPRDAIKTGQEDITLPSTFAQAREVNAASEYRPKLAEDLTTYEDPIYRDRAVFVPRPTSEALRAAADYLAPVADVRLEPVEGTELPTLNVVPRWDYEIDGMLSYIHKVKNGTDVYFIANSSNRPAELTATLRGTFRWLDIWNPITGETTRVDQNPEITTIDAEKGTTTVRMSLKSIECAMILGERVVPEPAEE